MTSGHQAKINHRDDYLATAAEFIRLAQEHRENFMAYQTLEEGQREDSARNLYMCARLAEVSIAMAAELRANQPYGMSPTRKWRP